MTQDSDGLSLQDFAQRMCCLRWEAWQQAKKELAVVGGPSTIKELAVRSSAAVNGGWSPPVQPERATAIACADRAYRALVDEVSASIKGGSCTLRAVPKGEHQPGEIWPALLDAVRIVNLQKSIIVTEGNRRFECVRVFMTAPVIATGATSVMGSAAAPSFDVPTFPKFLTNGERAVHAAVAALWPTMIVPSGLKAEVRDDKIMNWLKDHAGLSGYGESTIKRYFRKMKKPAPKWPALTVVGP